jgi:hypothetical protein
VGCRGVLGRHFRPEAGALGHVGQFVGEKGGSRPGIEAAYLCRYNYL